VSELIICGFIYILDCIKKIFLDQSWKFGGEMFRQIWAALVDGSDAAVFLPQRTHSISGANFEISIDRIRMPWFVATVDGLLDSAVGSSS
jgi:hypothetical protein